MEQNLKDEESTKDDLRFSEIIHQNEQQIIVGNDRHTMNSEDAHGDDGSKEFER